ncbi:MAG: hypothetical protein J6U10_00800 [Lachnospiraceae bacterium]|nr:hypothetical protein [Lachnospiraceae bacterium]
MNKKILALILVLCLVTIPLIRTDAANEPVTISTASATSGSATVSGTTEALAVMVRLTDADGNILAMQSFAVSDSGSFSASIGDLTLDFGTYTISVADYEGGSWASATAAITPSPSPSPTATVTPTPSPSPSPSPSPDPADAGDLDTDVDVSDDAPEVETVISLEQVLELLTEEEREAYENGADVLIYLSVDTLEAAEVPEEDKEKLDEYLGETGETGAIFLDLSLWKKVGGNAESKLSETGSELEITLEVPEELQNVPTGFTRTYRVLRVHNGVVEVVGESTEPVITVLSDKFSTYMLVYSDTKDPVVPQTSDNPFVKTLPWILAAVLLLAVLTPAILKAKKPQDLT